MKVQASIASGSSNQPAGVEGLREPSEQEAKIMRAFMVEHNGEFPYLSFSGIAARAQIDRSCVRRPTRALARKGYLEFGSGLWTDDGTPFGSGYCPTKAGYAYIEDLISSTSGSETRIGTSKSARGSKKSFPEKVITSLNLRRSRDDGG